MSPRYEGKPPARTQATTRNHRRTRHWQRRVLRLTCLDCHCPPSLTLPRPAQTARPWPLSPCATVDGSRRTPTGGITISGPWTTTEEFGLCCVSSTEVGIMRTAGFRVASPRRQGLPRTVVSSCCWARGSLAGQVHDPVRAPGRAAVGGECLLVHNKTTSAPARSSDCPAVSSSCPASSQRPAACSVSTSAKSTEYSTAGSSRAAPEQQPEPVRLRGGGPHQCGNADVVEVVGADGVGRVPAGTVQHGAVQVGTDPVQ